MDLMSRLSDGYGKLFTFSGRANRSQFWTLYVANLLILLVCFQLGSILPEALGLPVFLFGLVAVSFGNLSAAMRRLHDTNRSGWWVLASVVPLVLFAVIYFLIQPSVSGPTRYDAHDRTPSHPTDPLGNMHDVARALGS